MSHHRCRGRARRRIRWCWWPGDPQLNFGRADSAAQVVLGRVSLEARAVARKEGPTPRLHCGTCFTSTSQPTGRKKFRVEVPTSAGPAWMRRLRGTV